MNKLPWVGVALLTICTFSASAWANPASTDYVNRKINEMQTAFSHALDQASGRLSADINQSNARLSADINGLRKKPHRIGEIYQGGRIFFVDETGDHGLIVALNDANNGEGIAWKNGESGEKVTNARSSGIGAGAHNTRLIIAQQTIDLQNGNFAALAASSYSVLADGITPCTTRANTALPCYADWYLPSIYELDLMRNLLGDNAQTFYWSSTEAGVTEAWAQDIHSGEQHLMDKAASEVMVRAIRTF